jgi:hypothetical protein
MDSCNHGFQRSWPNMFNPLAGFQRGWTDMSDLQPGHVRVSEGIGLPIYRPIYWLGRPIFGRFPPADVDFLASRPVVVRPPPRFSSAAYPPLHPTRFTVRFRPTVADFGPLGPASAPLSTGANGERRIHFVAKLGRPNTIYMSSGPSGPIFTFFIQFEFYPTKR